MQTSIELTSTAQRHAARLGVAGALAALELGAWTQAGDVVELDRAAGPDAFVVRSRRVVVGADASLRLVLQLDHPPRP